MKRIIIFGSAGFIGTNLCKKLLSYGNYELHLIDLKSCDFKHNNCFFYNFDITLKKNKKLLQNIIKDDSIIIDLISKFGEDKKTNYTNINLSFLRSIVEVSNNFNNIRYYYFSSSSVYGYEYKNEICEYSTHNFNCDYGKSKSICEKYLQDNYSFHKNYLVIIRPSPVIDVNDLRGNFGLFAKFQKININLKIGKSLNKKSLCLLNNLSDFLLFLINKNIYENNIYNYADKINNKDFSLNEIYSFFNKDFKIKIYIPLIIFRIVCLVFDKFNINLFNNIKYKKYISYTMLDIKRTIGTGFKPKQNIKTELLKLSK